MKHFEECWIGWAESYFTNDCLAVVNCTLTSNIEYNC